MHKGNISCQYVTDLKFILGLGLQMYILYPTKENVICNFYIILEPLLFQLKLFQILLQELLLMEYLQAESPRNLKIKDPSHFTCLVSRWQQSPPHSSTTHQQIRWKKNSL